MTPETIHLLIFAAGLLLGLLLGHYLGVLRTWAKAHAQILAGAVDTAIAKAETSAKLAASAEIAKIQAEVEAAIAKAKTDAESALAAHV